MRIKNLEEHFNLRTTVRMHHYSGTESISGRGYVLTGFHLQDDDVGKQRVSALNQLC